MCYFDILAATLPLLDLELALAFALALRLAIELSAATLALALALAIFTVSKILGTLFPLLNRTKSC